jgi:PilZ domain
MSTRTALRMKVVLPVTIIRNDRPEKQLAHTLDVTSDSARLGGLYLPVEPGELIDLQRGAMRAKFYVFWVGAPNTMLAGQAGIRGLAPKSIWGVELPEDRPDQTVNTKEIRTGLPLVRAAHTSTDRRWQTRHACQGGAVIRAVGLHHPLYAQVSDVSAGGVYLETPSPLPPNTVLHVRMNIEGITMEMPAKVKTTEPSLGMGICFEKPSRENSDKLAMALQYLQIRTNHSPDSRPDQNSNNQPGPGRTLTI